MTTVSHYFTLVCVFPQTFAFFLTCTVLRLRGEAQQPISPLLSGALRKSGLPEASESVTLPLDSTFVGLIVEVQINGKPVRLMLDTGASLTFVSPATAQKLGLKAGGNIPGVKSSTGGGVDARLALTRSLSLGKAWTENEPVAVANLPPGIDGILGVSTLADWDVRIDFATKQLTLFSAGKAPPLEGETVLALTCELVNPDSSVSNRQGLRALNLRVPVHVGRHELPAIPDTGDGGILQMPGALMDKFAPEAMKDALPSLVIGVGLSGDIVSRTTKLPEFTFGPDTLRNLATDVVDATPGTASERQGILGLNLLRHYVMTFRFSAGELRLKPLGTVQEITQTSTAGIYFAADAAQGWLISDVVPDGPAARAGLRAGDEMLEIEGRSVKTLKPEELAAFKRLPPGSSVKARYRRGEGEPVEVTLVLVKK